MTHQISLPTVCGQYKSVRYYEGIVELCLCAAGHKDPQKLGLHFYKTAQPPEDSMGQKAYFDRYVDSSLEIDILGTLETCLPHNSFSVSQLFTRFPPSETCLPHNSFSVSQLFTQFPPSGSSATHACLTIHSVCHSYSPSSPLQRHACLTIHSVCHSYSPSSPLQRHACLTIHSVCHSYSPSSPLQAAVLLYPHCHTKPAAHTGPSAHPDLRYTHECRTNITTTTGE